MKPFHAKQKVREQSSLIPRHEPGNQTEASDTRISSGFLLHVEPREVNEFQLLVGSRASPLYFDLTGFVQAEGTVTVVHSS